MSNKIREALVVFRLCVWPVTKYYDAVPSVYDNVSQGRIQGGVGGLTPSKDYPADSEIWRKGVADRL